ncbi:MAG: aminotransferase class V-fold PLP-dependent enzyme [Dehalococcoidales bacterium]
MSEKGNTMDIKSLLDNPDLRTKEFPITATKIFLAHAAMSPFPKRTATAINEYVQRVSEEGQWEYLYADAETETRQYAAKLLEAEADEIAFVSSTSLGLSLVASGISWEAGDNVVIADGDFPSNIYPWLNLQKQGVQVKFIPRNKDGAVTLNDIVNVVDKNTRLVSLSTVNYVTGYRIDVPAIGAYLKQRNILFCLDAIQSLGVFPIDTTYVDFLAAGANKWLLGPVGIGILYVKKENIGLLDPALAGWKCVQDNHNYVCYNLNFLESAKRFEPGCVSLMGIIGLHAALTLLLEIEVKNIANRLTHFRKMLVPALNEKGYNVFGDDNPGTSSGITSFSSESCDILGLHNTLDGLGIVNSLREGLDGSKCIRVAPHFYNTEKEIMVFLDNIPQVDRQKIHAFENCNAALVDYHYD